jgi:putative solute:sodium symporter small subunit
MLEIVVGLLLLMGALGLVAAPVEVLPLSPVGNVPLLALAVAGLLLVVHGQFRRVRDRATTTRHWIRCQGIHALALLATAVVAVALPILLAPLGVVKIGGFPLGYYMAAQGLPIVLVALGFLVARMQDRADVEEMADDDT